MSARDHLSIGDELDGYRLLRVLRRDGAGTVFLAVATSGGDDVVVTALRDDDGQRVALAKQLITLRHPNLRPVLDTGRRDSVSFVVTALVDGDDLEAILERDGPLSPEATVAIVSGVAAALDTVRWARGVSHGTLGPTDVVVAADRVLVSGFWLDSDDGAGWLAPEQARGAQATARVDVYALACLARDCLGSHTPTSVAEVLDRGLADDPDHRFSTCGELSTALATAVARGDTVAGVPIPTPYDPPFSVVSEPAEVVIGEEPDDVITPAPAPRRRSRRQRAAVLALALAGAIAALGATWFAGRASSTSVSTEPNRALDAADPGVGPRAPVDPATLFAIPGSLLRIDAATGELIARIAIDYPLLLAAGGRSLWVLSDPPTADARLIRFALPTGTVGRVFDIDLGVRDTAWSLASTGDRAWLANGRSLYTFGPEADARGERVAFALVGDAPPTVWGVSGTLWLSLPTFTPGLLKLSPSTRRTVAHLSGVGAIIAAGPDFLWASRLTGGGLLRVDARTNETSLAGGRATCTASHPSLCGANWIDFAYADGSMWAVAPRPSAIVRIDPRTARPLESIEVAGELRHIAAGGGAIWASRDDDVVRYDPATRRLDTIDVGGRPGELVAAHGSVWVLVEDDPPPGRISTRQHLALAAAVCRQATDAYEKDAPSGLFDTAAAARRANDALAELRRLPMPEGPDRAKLDELYGLIDEQTDLLQRAAAASIAGDPERAHRLGVQRLGVYRLFYDRMVTMLGSPALESCPVALPGEALPAPPAVS